MEDTGLYSIYCSVRHGRRQHPRAPGARRGKNGPS